METITSSSHGFQKGDLVSIHLPDERWWKRLWCWITFQPPPTRVILRRVERVDLDFFELGDEVEDLEDSIEDDVDWGKVCSRCFDEVDTLYPPNCNEKPERLVGAPLGQYHCPDCGTMVVAGIEHGHLCRRCLDREHPNFDRPPSLDKNEKSL